MPTNEIDSLEGLHPPDGVTRAAVLVIHGIGSQAPYETLDGFVQGVARHYDLPKETLQHRLVSTKLGTLSLVRMPLPQPVGRAAAREIDFYEFHWAGMVEGKIWLWQVLGWLARTALSPLELWAQQASLILDTRQATTSGAAKASLAKLFVAEIGRAALILFFAAAVLSPFLYVAAHPDLLREAWERLGQAVNSPREIAVLTFLAVSLLFILAAARGGFDLLWKIRSGPDTERAAGRWWGIASVATAGVFAAIAYAADLLFHLDTLGIAWRFLIALKAKAILGPLVAIGIAGWLGKVMVDYVGDIALYTTADENSAFYRTRAAILARSAGFLNLLCEEMPYRGVYLAGHSLGTVIAYDTINRYIRDTRAGAASTEPGKGIDRLRGLLTFGSPLDAVYYFFRTEVSSDQAIRAQILSSLHGFRKRPSGRDYGALALAPYTIPRLPDCRWLNVYSHADLISRRLAFYEVDEQVGRNYFWNPLTAHMAYWRDKEFYARVADWF